MHWVILLFVLGSICNLHASIYKERKALHQLIYTIRHENTDSKHFRETLSKIGYFMGMELQEELEHANRPVTTRMNTSALHPVLVDKPVLVGILRAGLPLLNGLEEVFDDCEVGFLGTARDEKSLKPVTSYIALPKLEGKTVVIADTMVATGGSIHDAIKIMRTRGAAKIFVVCAIASQKGIDFLQKTDPDVPIFAAAIDPILNQKGYIVPGLGDAGDICFGDKLG